MATFPLYQQMKFTLICNPINKTHEKKQKASSLFLLSVL